MYVMKSWARERMQKKKDIQEKCKEDQMLGCCQKQDKERDMVTDRGWRNFRTWLREGMLEREEKGRKKTAWGVLVAP